MKNRIKLLLICTLLCLFWMVPAQAQEEDNEGVGVLVQITAKAGHEEALLKGVKDYHHWVANFEGHMEYTWWEVLTGPDTGKYYAHSGNHDWADFDVEHDWQKKAGEVFRTNVRPHIENAERSMQQGMDKVSYWPEDWDGYNQLQIETWYIHNGQSNKFNKGLKRIVDTLKANDFPHRFGFVRVVSGGHGGEIELISPVKGWAGMSDEDPSFYDIMTKELGGEDEFNTFMADWGSSFKVGRKEMVKYMPEASDYGNE